MTLAAGLLAAPLWLAALAAPPPTATAATQKIAVEVRGPVALVEVTRALASEGRGAEHLLDVALPEHAALVDVAVRDRGAWRPIERRGAGGRDARVRRRPRKARRHARARALRRRHDPPPPRRDRPERARPASATASPSCPRRSRAAAASGSPPRPSARPSPRTSPPRSRGRRDVEIAGARGPRGRASTRSAWEISWAPRGPRAKVEGRMTWKRISPTETLAAVSVEAHGTTPAPPPASVLFVIDRSRSVGLPGLAAERDLAGRLLEALPPVDALRRLVLRPRRAAPVPHEPPRDARGPRRAGRRDGPRSVAGTAPTSSVSCATRVRSCGARRARSRRARWLVLVTDGALPEGSDGAALDGALGRTPGVELQAGDVHRAPHGRRSRARAGDAGAPAARGPAERAPA